MEIGLEELGAEVERPEEERFKGLTGAPAEDGLELASCTRVSTYVPISLLINELLQLLTMH